MMKKWVNQWSVRFVAVFFYMFWGSSLLGGAGTSGGDFLKISTYSRGMAVGGAWVAAAEGTGALYYNPAGVGRKGAGEFSVSHSALYQDLKLENVSVAYPLSNGSGIGFGINYLGYGSIEGYDVSGAPTGNVSAYSLLLTLAASQRISENLSLGVAVKPIFERLGENSASTITADLGMMADFGQFSFGAQLANWGGSVKFAAEKVALPTTLRFGLAYRTLRNGSTVSVGASRDSKSGYAVNTGIEYFYSENLVLRTGYSTSLQDQNSAADGISGGIGLRIQSFGVDYSYRPSGELDGVHQFTASYRFGK